MSVSHLEGPSLAVGAGVIAPPIPAVDDGSDDGDVIHTLVSKWGVPFIAGALVSFPQRYTAPGFCVRNSAAIALQQPHFHYVEGLCWYPNGKASVHHAWLTRDGVHALDPTYGDNEAIRCCYFGIAFSQDALRCMLERGRWDDLFAGDDYAPFGILQLQAAGVLA